MLGDFNMSTSTTIYLVTQINSDRTSFSLITFFSECKAYRHVTDLVVGGSEFDYDVTPIQLLGD